jgi:hypothetical protein
MPSRALEEMIGPRLAEVQTLLGRRPIVPESHRNRQEQEEAGAVNRAAVVLLCAHFEGYLGDLAEDVVDYLNGNAPALSDIPDALLACQVDDELETIFGMTDRARRVSRTTSLIESFGTMWVGNTLSGSPLKADALVGDLGNPKPRAVQRLFDRIGIEAVLDQVAISSGNATWRLNELVDGRNDIAHGRERSVLDGDVKRDLRFVRDLSVELDELTNSHLQGICGSPVRPWA